MHRGACGSIQHRFCLAQSESLRQRASVSTSGHIAQQDHVALNLVSGLGEEYERLRFDRIWGGVSVLSVPALTASRRSSTPRAALDDHWRRNLHDLQPTLAAMYQ